MPEGSVSGCSLASRCSRKSLNLLKASLRDSGCAILTKWLRWLSWAQALFREVENYHLGQIFATGELEEEAVIRKFPITAADGKDYDMLMATIRKFEIVQTEGTREVNRSQIIYNLDAIMYMQASKKMTSPVCIGKRLV